MQSKSIEALPSLSRLRAGQCFEFRDENDSGVKDKQDKQLVEFN